VIVQQKIGRKPLIHRVSIASIHPEPTDNQSVLFTFFYLPTFAHSKSITTASFRQTRLALVARHTPTTTPPPPPRCLLGAKPRLSQRPLFGFNKNSSNSLCLIYHQSATNPFAQSRQFQSFRIIRDHRPYHTLSNLVAMSSAPAGTMTMNEYTFPTERLQLQLRDPSRTPLVLVACGSFSPITFLHLRMFEMAADYARFNTNYEVVGAYISAVGDAYKKSGLVKAEHRINMCSLAVEQSSWISGMF
jgi:hypothetical protein